MVSQTFWRFLRMAGVMPEFLKKKEDGERVRNKQSKCWSPFAF